MLCRDLMKTTVITCREEDSLHRCAELMKEWKIGLLPVVDRVGHVVGVVTDRDIVVRGLAENRPLSTESRSIMTKDVVACQPGDELWLAEERMGSARKSRILVVDEARRCLGIISLSDVSQAEDGLRAGELLQRVTRREASPPRTAGH
jgi:CBS domain-containing protein